MVIAEADSDAVKKRPRLSLKAYRQMEKSPAVGTSKTSVAHAVKSPVKQRLDQKEDQVVPSSKTKEDHEEGRKKEERAKVPPVSSLENLGNTCFLNSILQVLRYTPGFVSSLSRLYHYILLVEKRKKLENAEREESEDVKEASGSEVCEVVKNLFRLYRSMNRKESSYEEIASDDVMSMALRPNKVLRSISELNSMFEGNLQHDAQELLRCLLCYLQEAEGEVSKYQDHIKLSDKTTDGKPVNPIMQRFLKGSFKAGGSGEPAESAKDSSDCCKNVPGDGPTIDSVKMNLFPKTDIIDQIDKMEAIKLNNPTMPRHGDTASVVDWASVTANVIDQTSASGFPEQLLSSNGSGTADFSTLNSEENAAFPAVLKNLSKQRTNIAKPGRAVARRGRGRPRTRNSSTKNTDVEMTEKMLNTSEGARNKPDDLNESELVNPEGIQKKHSLARSQTHFQRSIISMLEHSMMGRGRRLGLRGAVRKQESVSLMKTEDQSNLVETENNNQSSMKSNQFHSKRRNCDMGNQESNQACDEAGIGDQDEVVINIKRKKLENASSSRAETCTIQTEKKAVYEDLEVEEEVVDLIPEGDFSPSKEQIGQCVKENILPLSSALKYATDSCKELVHCIRSSPRKLLSSISSLAGGKDVVAKSSNDKSNGYISPRKLLKEARSPKKSEQIISENFEEKSVLSEIKSPTGAITPCKRASSPRKSANTQKQPQELTTKMLATSPAKAKLRSPDKRENSQPMSQASAASVESCIQSPSMCCSLRNQETSSKTLQKMSESRSLEQSNPTPQKHLQPYIKLEKIDHLCSNVVKTKTKHVAENQILRRSVRNSNSPYKRHVNGKSVCKREITELTSDEELDDLEDIFSMKPECISPGSQASSPGVKCLCIPTPQKLHKDFVERLFQGTMKLETRCLECEAATEKREEFHDISVPVKLEELDSDNEDQTDGSPPSPCMTQLIKASIKVEKLAGDNKYYCESCLHKVEAQRSIQYEILPDILTLHLKRFSAGSGSFGYISKINDHINIPMSLPCIKSRCSTSCRRMDHRYILYGIVTHAGFSLGSGHYLAYVRALPPETTKDKSITSMFLSQIKNETAGANESLSEGTGHATRYKTGAHIKLPSRFENSVSLDRKIRPLAGSMMKEENFKPKKNLTASNKWYEVDDETVRIFQEDEFQDLLIGKTGSLIGTPYLLFYHKGSIL